MLLNPVSMKTGEDQDVSINQFITTALAEKLAVLMTVEYLEERGKRGSRREFRRALSKVRDRKPDAVPPRSTARQTSIGSRRRGFGL